MSRVALITGVSGGIGLATAEVFLNAGWQVVGVDRYQFDNDNLPEAIQFIQADISKPQDQAYIFEQILTHRGQLDALINNAAIQIAKPLIETTLEEWDKIMSNNLRSVFLGVRHAYPLLKAQKGAIINVSSVHAVATSRNIAAYAASKGALLALTRAMALEFGEDNIRVNAILPGAVDTTMLRNGLKRGHVAGDSMEELVRGLGHKHVMGRVGHPTEIGQAILFLADNMQSSFITGQALIVDGGATARLSTE